MRAGRKIILFAYLTISCIGCHTVSENTSPVTPTKGRFSPGSLKVDYYPYRTLDELRRAVVDPYGEDAGLYVFEKDDAKVAICKQLWNGVGWNALIVYGYREDTQSWLPYVVWNTQARDVAVTFNKPTGMIEVRSGGGMLIFQANISALRFRKVPWNW
jgi:hypothetical protein